MIKAGQISKGMFLKFKNEPYLVADREFVNPGKGTAFVRLKLKSLMSGAVLRQTVKSQESVEDIIVEEKKAQFLYMDNDDYHFMDNETFEQYEIPIEGMERQKNFLKEGEEFYVVFYEDRPIDIKLPFKMVFTITEAEHAEKGDTVTGATKMVTVETGFKVKVPIFIKQGERIMINTETGDYVERVN